MRKILALFCGLCISFSQVAAHAEDFENAILTVDKSNTVKNVDIVTVEELKNFIENVTYVDGDVNINPMLDRDQQLEIAFPKLTGVSGYLTFGGQVLKGQLSFPVLVEVGGGLNISTASYPNLYLTSLSLPKLQHLGGRIDLVRTSIKDPNQIILGYEEIRARIKMK